MENEVVHYDREELIKVIKETLTTIPKEDVFDIEERPPLVFPSKPDSFLHLKKELETLIRQKTWIEDTPNQGKDVILDPARDVVNQAFMETHRRVALSAKPAKDDMEAREVWYEKELLERDFWYKHYKQQSKNNMVCFHLFIFSQFKTHNKNTKNLIIFRFISRTSWRI